jgi:hypothetical protein
MVQPRGDSPLRSDNHMQTFITRYAIMGAVFGVISMSIWAALTHAMPVATGAGAGFLAGVAGGTVVGLGTALRQR